ncbi:MAG TPA: GNAT family N-acetyltransferase [Sphingomicrobium sp.]|nr:GNAT family N-acetyltransferase [Sphingomicrobium sp.]
MIDPFYHLAWADAHEKLAIDVAARLAHLARWLGRRASPKEDDGADETSAMRQLMSHAITIAADAALGADAQYCLAEYNSELQRRFDVGFDPELSLLPSLDESTPPQGTFLVVRLNGEPVGCGGLKRISKDAAYLKRMWIAPAARRRGLARRLLAALEDEARAMGYSIVRLETNKALVEAQELYRSSGYAEVAPFNDERYAHHWFEKRVDQSAKGLGRLAPTDARAGKRRVGGNRVMAPHVRPTPAG